MRLSQCIVEANLIDRRYENGRAQSKADVRNRSIGTSCSGVVSLGDGHPGASDAFERRRVIRTQDVEEAQTVASEGSLGDVQVAREDHEVVLWTGYPESLVKVELQILGVGLLRIEELVRVGL